MATQDTHSLSPTGTDPNTGTEQGIKNKVSDMASQAKNTAADWGRSAAGAVDRNLHTAAGALENTASKLRDKAPASGKVNEIATATATKIESTARYLREHDTERHGRGRGISGTPQSGSFALRRAGGGFSNRDGDAEGSRLLLKIALFWRAQQDRFFMD